MTSEDGNCGSVLVKPEVLKGFQDVLPDNAILRNMVIAKVRDVFARFGFLPIDTPALEYLAVLVGTGGEDTNKQIFRLKSPEHEDIGLRFDLTVPFARFTAQHLDDLKLPFRRQHVASVWRADDPGAGRFREFTQFDFDAFGSASMAVDAEIVRATCDVMAALNVSEYVLLVNHRKIVDALLKSCGVTGEEQHKHVLRVIDKLAKVGLDEVRKELGAGRVDKSGDSIKGAGLDGESIRLIERFLNLTGDSRRTILDGVRRILPKMPDADEAVTEVDDFLNGLDSLGVEEERVRFTPTLARGLDYYTGPVFETILPAAAKFGSIMGGGRYDALVKRFLGFGIPATGASIGIDRFLAALRDIKAVSAVPTTTTVMVAMIGQKVVCEALSMATELRQAGINTEVYFGQPDDGLRAQLALANRRGIPVAVIIGEDEVKGGVVAVKDLREGAEKRKGITDREEYRARGKSGQVTVPRAECVRTVREILE
jgi:histidyl-tRNA synthetase